MQKIKIKKKTHGKLRTHYLLRTRRVLYPLDHRLLYTSRRFVGVNTIRSEYAKCHCIFASEIEKLIRVMFLKLKIFNSNEYY